MIRTYLKLIAIAMTTAVVLVGCGDEAVIDVGQAQKPTNTAANFAQSVSSYPGKPPEGADPFDCLATPGAWIHLTAVSSTPDKEVDGAAFIRAATELIGGDVAAVEAWKARANDKSTLRSTTTTAQLAAKAASSGAEVYAKTGFDGDPQEIILIVAFKGDQFGFVGECKYERFTVPLQKRFGEDATGIVRSIIGADAAHTAEVLSEERPNLPGVKVLNPQYDYLGELSQLELASFKLADLPASWIGPYTICTRIKLGWSDCVDLSSAELASIEVSAYVDPKSPTIEVWLLDSDANLREPIAKLATATVPSDLLGSLHDDRTARLTVSLPPDRSVSDAVRDPATAGAGVELAAAESAR